MNWIEKNYLHLETLFVKQIELTQNISGKEFENILLIIYVTRDYFSFYLPPMWLQNVCNIFKGGFGGNKSSNGGCKSKNKQIKTKNEKTLF